MGESPWSVVTKKRRWTPLVAVSLLAAAVAGLWTASVSVRPRRLEHARARPSARANPDHAPSLPRRQLARDPPPVAKHAPGLPPPLPPVMPDPPPIPPGSEDLFAPLPVAVETVPDEDDWPPAQDDDRDVATEDPPPSPPPPDPNLFEPPPVPMVPTDPEGPDDPAPGEQLEPPPPTDAEQ